MKILYAGDSPVGGPANYLLAILRFLKADFIHIPPHKKLSESLFRRNRFDGILLSDFPRKNISHSAQKAVVDQIQKGAGLLMVGGWASFSGPFGGWRGSEIEKLLPVSCLSRDDRVNFPGGAWIVQKKKHPMFRLMNFKNPPVICGLNRVRPRKKSITVLDARKIAAKKNPSVYPLLVIDANPKKRIAALTTDLAPHWSGGLVDWGRGRMKLSVGRGVRIEIGEFYLTFVSSLVKWLARKVDD